MLKEYCSGGKAVCVCGCILGSLAAPAAAGFRKVMKSEEAFLLVFAVGLQSCFAGSGEAQSQGGPCYCLHGSSAWNHTAEVLCLETRVTGSSSAPVLCSPLLFIFTLLPFPSPGPNLQPLLG